MGSRGGLQETLKNLTALGFLAFRKVQYWKKKLVLLFMSLNIRELIINLFFKKICRWKNSWLLPKMSECSYTQHWQNKENKSWLQDLTLFLQACYITDMKINIWAVNNFQNCRITEYSEWKGTHKGHQSPTLALHGKPQESHHVIFRLKQFMFWSGEDFVLLYVIQGESWVAFSWSLYSTMVGVEYLTMSKPWVKFKFIKFRNFIWEPGRFPKNWIWL